ncbi:SpoIID/LytB domain protein [Phycicoccus badiiscoriae]|uniref:SpoIID/LytB domain protein n=1 Tax=Pedococcus badiiscoriae TaxID=642776 RepID=A0A852WN48_9MICO|nr:SpoIID/LytB domain-containing protein [Pedococcus badiiscoriae]NYG07655.1 SpoIID/LytB domain protein [Pedococcus badiiscoriae]
MNVKNVRLRHVRSRAAAAMGAVALAAPFVLAAASPAAAAETYLRPASGVFPIDGRGFGHGHGMSQYGAKGAAEGQTGRPGLTWPDIMAFYYPGTTIGDIGGTGNNPLLRVRLVGQTTLPVVAQSGLRVTLDPTAAGGGWHVLPPTVTQGGQTHPVESWDVAYFKDTNPAAPDYSGWYLRFRWVGSTGFLNYQKAPATAPNTARSTAFDNPSTGMLRKGTSTKYSTYRGELRHVHALSKAGSKWTVTVVDALPMESYLRDVVPNEMPASWSREAVRSQAVASRTYADYDRLHAPPSRAYDTCDTTSCQVMKPVETEQATSDAAVIATAGKTVKYQGSSAYAQFSASNGGYMLDGGHPYLVSKPDPYDTFTWTNTASATTIEQSWPSIGRLISLSLTRDGHGAWGGRVTSVDIRGSSTTVTVSGNEFAYAMGFMSSFFKPRSTRVSAPSFPKDTTSDGRADVVAAVTATSQLRVYPGRGGGAFSTPVIDSGTVVNPAKAFMAGTWDTGSVADLMAVAPDGSLQWFRGKGNGTFGPPVTLGTGYGGYTLMSGVGDLNGDGGTDVVGRRSDGALMLLAGDGQGGLLGQSVIGTGWDGFTTIFSPGDFNGDGRTDLMGIDGAGNLRLYRGVGNGTFQTAILVGWGWSSFTSVSSPGDFDGDGKADVLCRRADGSLWLYPGNGAGGWGRARQIGTGWSGLTILR